MYKNGIDRNFTEAKIKSSFGFIVICLLLEISGLGLLCLPKFQRFCDAGLFCGGGRQRQGVPGAAPVGQNQDGNANGSVGTSLTSLSEADTYRRYACLDDWSSEPRASSYSVFTVNTLSLSEVDTFRRYAFDDVTSVPPGAINNADRSHSDSKIDTASFESTV